MWMDSACHHACIQSTGMHAKYVRETNIKLLISVPSRFFSYYALRHYQGRGLRNAAMHLPVSLSDDECWDERIDL